MSRGAKVMTTTIESLLTATVSELFNLVRKVLDKKKIPYLEGKDYIVTDRNSDHPLPLICVHLDTVSLFPPSLKDLVTVNGIIALKKGSNATCLGADDRAGLWIALKMIEEGCKTKFNFGFFDHEERGAMGSSAFSDDHIYFEASCLIGLDRADKKAPNVATYGYDNDELIGIFKDFGYVEGYGTFSDCSNLAMQFGIPCVNLSVGYQNEHSAKETLSIQSMTRTLEVMRAVEIPVKDYLIEVEDYRPMSYYGSGLELEYEEVVCHYCGRHERLYSLKGVQLCEFCIELNN